MRFNPKAGLDTGRVSDGGSSGGRGSLGRSGSGGGMRMPIPSGGKAGGGIVGLLLIVVLIVAANLFGGGGSSSTGFDQPAAQAGNDTSRTGDDSERYANCRTGADAQEDTDCARIAVENSLYDFWSGYLPQNTDVRFAPATMTTFVGGTQTGCGQATSQVGPFYCPVDQGIYLDTTFFQQVLQDQLGGPAGAFVEPYVLAHEYGHHIQNLMGTMSRVRTQQGANSDAVRLELQADCYAGLWTKYAETTEDANGQVLIQDITDQDITEAIAAAGAVGDDRIQEKTQGQVTPESWTHGSAQQRTNWFQRGYRSGDLGQCDTFAATSL